MITETMITRTEHPNGMEIENGQSGLCHRCGKVLSQYVLEAPGNVWFAFDTWCYHLRKPVYDYPSGRRGNWHRGRIMMEGEPEESAIQQIKSNPFIFESEDGPIALCPTCAGMVTEKAMEPISEALVEFAIETSGQMSLF